jgi:Family of unknown function (DUF5961)
LPEFNICAADIDAFAGRTMTAASFEAAAIAFAETAHVAVAEELRLVVRDLESGVERRFALVIAAGPA